MPQSVDMNWVDILAFADLLLTSAVVVLAFSLLIYLVAYNWRNAVARAFCAIMACVVIVYACDVVLPRADASEAALLWLRVQWLGISFIPAAYLHFSDALLRTTNAASERRRWLVRLGYLFGAVACGLALFTDYLVRDGVVRPPITHLVAGPLFQIFTAYFVVTVCFGVYNIYRARQRSLTPTSRRRMAYLGVSFLGPAVGVFPYLVLVGRPDPASPLVLLSLSMVGNMGVSVMLVVMSYTVAYYGALTPDRIVKHRLIHYLLRGPLVGSAVIVTVLSIPKVEAILGLPRDTIIIFAAMIVVVMGEMAVNLLKPFIDRLIYWRDADEVNLIQELDRRLLTSGDMAQFLENVLIAICELLRVPDGFVAVVRDSDLFVDVACGAVRRADPVLDERDWVAVMQQLKPLVKRDDLPLYARCVSHAGFWFWPLLTRKEQRLLGVLAVKARTAEPLMTEQEGACVGVLLSRAAMALEDRSLQQTVFVALQRMMPELERIQEWRQSPPFAGGVWLREEPELAAVDMEELQRWVKDALSHYWGGPRLTRSPLLQLRIVNQALEEEDGNPARAVRSVLGRAIERLRPPGERHMTASEWLLYNILDLKFIQGKRVREVAQRLAMSESDFYRKQRIAIAEVAKILAEMEAQEAQQMGDRYGSLQNLDKDSEAAYNGR